MFNFLALTGGTGDLVSTLIMFAVIGVVFYFFMIRPQKKQDKEISEMRNNLEVGDEVTTIGGVIGEIVSIKDETVLIETGRDHTRIRFLRSAIRCVDVPASSKGGYRINSEENEPAEQDVAAESFENVEADNKKAKKKK